jgi:long-subunit fatty acid transport protein
VAASAALLCTLGAGVPGAAASPLRLFGFGGRSPALAGAGVASAVDYDSVFLNPAGLGDVRRQRLTVGRLYGRFDLTLDNERADTAAAEGTIFGAVFPIRLGGALRDRVGLGIALHIPRETINKAYAPYPGVPFYALLETSSQVIAIQVGTGWRLGSTWRVGFGVITLAALRGNIHVASDAAGRFTTRSEQRIVTQFAPILGLRRHFNRRPLALGLTFRGVARSDYDVKVTNDLGDTLPLTLPVMVMAGAAQYDPLTVAAEAAYLWRGALLASTQLAYERWSAFPLPTENPTAASPPQQPAEFHDTLVPRLALEWTTRVSASGSLALRGGYAFVMSPAPEMTGQQSLLDNHRHVVALGVGVAFPGLAVPLRIDAWAQAHLLVPRTHEKDPSALPPGETPVFDRISTRGHILAGGLTLGVDL